MFTSRGQPVLRCAIYTRQSVARGEQDLTSCDVQRERCEDYVRAMQYEGWVALDERFDDLGACGTRTGNLRASRSAVQETNRDVTIDHDRAFSRGVHRG